MTALPFELLRQWPRGPLTAAEYLAIGETEYPTELHEGWLIVLPPQRPRYARATFRLTTAIDAALTSSLEVYYGVDVDLELVASEEPGFVPRPDVTVAHAGSARHVEEHGGVLRASDVVLAVEIVSPSSRKMDRVLKRDEYADAGIPHYWIVDLDEPISLLACHLAGELGYADDGEVTGTFRTTEPFRFELDLSSLTSRAS